MDVQGHIGQRIESLRSHIKEHVDETTMGVKTVASGKAIGDLLSLKPVQAATDLAVDVINGIGKGVIIDNVETVIDSVRSQAALTRQGRA